MKCQSACLSESLVVKCLVVIFCFVVGGQASAALHRTDGTAQDTQAKVNLAVSGDIVRLPAQGVFRWSSGVIIPSTKGITLDFNGSTIIRGVGSDRLVSIRNNPTTTTRMTGGTFLEHTTHTILRIDGLFSNAKFRVDHCTFTSTATPAVLVDIHKAWGVVDHCGFNAGRNSEIIHNWGYGPTDDRGWHEDIVPGSIDAVYIEDCTFTNNLVSGNPAYFYGNSAIQGYYGCRTVLRNNTFYMSHIDMHGGPLGARWWEVYSNTWYVVQNGNQDRYMGMRAGSGVIFHNRKTGFANQGGGAIDLGLQATDSTIYRTGRGKDLALDPAYVWGNDSTMDVGGDDRVLINRDYYPSAKPNYTPHTYPHPLNTPTKNKPPGPSNLRAIP